MKPRRSEGDERRDHHEDRGSISEPPGCRRGPRHRAGQSGRRETRRKSNCEQHHANGLHDGVARRLAFYSTDGSMSWASAAGLAPATRTAHPSHARIADRK